ncbi:uncharacterized protein bean1 [Rhincodon typus]|uniref:uncharacterized protein bean1 n=1 Tax=Rhincodon typus TaxID=259920 RepID=UPI002030ED20|nr:uncharacterized protein bean1 [Rhincodon typus]
MVWPNTKGKLVAKQPTSPREACPEQPEHALGTEQSILPCKKEELQCGNGLCLLNWLHCQYRKDCGQEYTSVKLICSNVARPAHFLQHSLCLLLSGYNGLRAQQESRCHCNGSEHPLLWTGLSKHELDRSDSPGERDIDQLGNGCSANSLERIKTEEYAARMERAPDGFSFGGSVGELQSTCVEEYPPTFDIDSYIETLSQINVMYQDSPPHYEDCVGHRAPDLYLPEEDPPPYSLTDPRQRNDSTHREPPEDEARSQGPGDPPHVPSLPSESQQMVMSISSSSVPLDQAPPYEQVVFNRQEVALPLSPPGELKDTPEECRPISRTIV